MRNARSSWNNHHLVARAFLAFFHEVVGEEKQYKNNRKTTERPHIESRNIKIDSVKGLDIDFVKGLHLSHKYERLAINSVKKEREASDKDGRKQQQHGIREIK